MRGMRHVVSGGGDSGSSCSSRAAGSISRSGRGGVSSGREFVRRRRRSRQTALYTRLVLDCCLFLHRLSRYGRMMLVG